MLLYGFFSDSLRLRASFSLGPPVESSVLLQHHTPEFAARPSTFLLALQRKRHSWARCAACHGELLFACLLACLLLLMCLASLVFLCFACLIFLHSLVASSCVFHSFFSGEVQAMRVAASMRCTSVVACLKLAKSGSFSGRAPYLRRCS